MNSATRGVVLAVFAVLLGVIILGRGFDDPTVATGDATPTTAPSDDAGTDVAADDGSADAAATDDGTTETPAADDGTTEDGTTETPAADDGTTEDGTTETPAADDSATDGANAGPKPAAEVRVLVANDTTVGGLAGTVTNTLTAEGYATLTPTNTTTQGADAAAPSVVYFAQGYRPDAIVVAGLLGLAETAVAQMPETPPVADLGRANLLVVVGANLVPAA